MRFYTIHLPRRPWAPDKTLAEARAVKDGFSWPAFFFSFVWALWHRLWFAAIVIIVIEFILGTIVDAFGIDIVTDSALSLGFAMIVGWIANDLRRGRLARQGLAEAGVVIAGSQEDAVRRYFTEGGR
jgi:hypothetical protein